MDGALSLERYETADFMRTPPHNYEAERAFLAALMSRNRLLERIPETFSPEHFADPVNGRIFAACKKLIDEGADANVITLKSYLENDELVKGAGGHKYLVSLMAGVVTTVNGQHYAKLIHDYHRRRQIMALGQSMIQRAEQMEGDEEVDDLVTAIDQEFTDIASDKTVSKGLRPLNIIRPETISRWEEENAHEGPVGLTLGISDLDRKLRGIGGTDLVIIAGRPSMGKTALAVTAVRNIARRNKAANLTSAAAVFSMEMSAGQLDGRLVTMESGVTAPRVKRLEAHDFAKVMAQDPALPVWIDDGAATTLSHIRRECLRLKRRQGLSVVVVDYLQLLRPETGLRIDNRVHLVGHFSRTLKALAKELEAPVIALSQLSRQVEQREDKRPVMSDLRDSGEIEQDADIIMFTYRHQYYLEKSEPQRRTEETSEKFGQRYTAWETELEGCRNQADIIIAKHRHDRTGSAKLYFDPERTVFEDLARTGPPAGHPASFGYRD